MNRVERMRFFISSLCLVVAGSFPDDFLPFSKDKDSKKECLIVGTVLVFCSCWSKKADNYGLYNSLAPLSIVVLHP